MLKPRGPAQPHGFSSSGFEILNIFKYKMYPYIFRTFGNRNILGHLFKNSGTGLKGFRKLLESFFENWNVPEGLREPHRARMRAWSKYILAHSEIHSDLKMGRYLDHFTAFEEVADQYDGEETLPVFIMGGTFGDVEGIVRNLDGNHTLQRFTKTSKYQQHGGSIKYCDSLPKGHGKVVFILPDNDNSSEYRKVEGLMSSSLRGENEVFLLDPGEKVASLGKNLTF